MIERVKQSGFGQLTHAIGQGVRAIFPNIMQPSVMVESQQQVISLIDLPSVMGQDEDLVAAQNPQRENPRPRRRDLISSGGTIREADVNNLEELQAVLSLYQQPFALPHFANAKPTETVNQIQEYYRTHPEATLYIAMLPGEGIVGAVTKTLEEGLRSFKLNRLVVRKDMQGKDVGGRLVREALASGFHEVDERGMPKYTRVLVGVIKFDSRKEREEAEGSNRALGLFKRFGFRELLSTPRICDSWSFREEKLVDREAMMLGLLRNEYVMTRGNDVRRGTSLPLSRQKDIFVPDK